MKQYQLLSDVCEFIVDCEHKTAPTQPTGYPSIRTPNIGRGKLILDNVNRVSEETYKAWTKRAIPQKNDLILAREAPVGNVAIIPENLKVCLGQRTVLIRPDKRKVDPRYLCYLLLGDEIQGKFLSISNGATVHHLNLKDIRNLELPEIPNIPTQQKIAAILSNYDDLIENNTRRIKILEEMAQTLYYEWFVKFRFPGHEQVKMVESELGLIPEGWEVINFTDIADVLSGGTPKTKISEYWNGSIPFFTPKDTPDNFYVMQTEKSITELGLSKCNSKLYPKNTVFITARGTVGKAVMTAVDMAMNQSCFALRGKDNINQYFVFLTIKNYVEYLQKAASGATFDAIIIDNFRRLIVIKPNIILINKFDNLISPTFEQIINLIQKNQNLRTTRDLLLPKLISGEIDVENLEIDTGNIAA
jgi:type I restriction enzyme S subunit